MNPFMKEALLLAEKSLETEDVPIGAVIVKDGETIGRGNNQKQGKKDPTAHGEMIAIREAAKHLGHWWLEDCEMYVTLEPCAMCGGAIVNSRIGHLYIGARNKRFGACGSSLDVVNGPSSNHHVAITYGLMEEECVTLLETFFRALRKKKKEEKDL